jgi:hypothetical protein
VPPFGEPAGKVVVFDLDLGQRLCGTEGTAWWRTQSQSNLSPPPNSLLTGKKNGEFFNFGPDSGLEHPMRPMISRAFEQIPYVTEQGIISAEQGILLQEQGIFSVKFEITPE